jgi:hypothetical protein
LAAALKKRDEALSEVNNRKVLYDSILSKLDKEMFEEGSLRKLKEKITDDFGFGKYRFSMIDNVVDIEVVGDGYSFDNYREVEVYFIKKDGTKTEIYGNWIVLEGAPVYKKKKKVRENVISHLVKYKNVELINFLADIILEKAKSKSGFSLTAINEVKIRLSNFSGGKFWSCRVSIYLEDNTKITIYDTDPLIGDKVKISKTELESIGGKDGNDF